jgi:hypothetical protein
MTWAFLAGVLAGLVLAAAWLVRQVTSESWPI